MKTANICRLLREYQPDEFYNLAAQSFVSVSWEEPIYTAQADGIGVVYILEAIREFSKDALLSGFYFRNVWQGAGNSANGKNAVLSA